MSFEINKKIQSQDQQTSKPNTAEGITESELNQKLGNKLQKEVNNIFTQFNTNQTANAQNEQVLDRNEQVSLMAYLKQLAGEDENITRKEYKNAKKSGTTVGSNVSYKDLKKIASAVDEIIGQCGSAITYGTTDDGISITADGSQYTVQNDDSGAASSVSQEVTETGETKTYTYDNENHLSGITGTSDNITNTYDLNGETVLKKETTDDDGSVTSTETYEYDSAGNVSSTTKVSGAVTENFDSQGRITKKTIDLGRGLTDTTTYEYGSDGTVTETNKNDAAGTSTVTIIKNGNAAKETVTTKDGTVTETIYDESGKPSSQTITGSDGSVNETTYNQDGGKTVNYTSGDYNSKTEYNSSGNRTSQTVTADGQEYTAEYDGDGNTKGVIVQNGESPAAIAQKFGCSVEDLKNANKDILKGKAPGQYFPVGAEIKIPNEINADEFARLQTGRKSSEDAKADYTQMMEERAAKKAALEAQYKELGLINHEGEGSKIKGKYQKSGREIECTVIGKCDNGRTLAKDENGNLIVISHDGFILKNEYVKDKGAQEYNAGLKKRKQAQSLAKEFYQIADDNSGVNSMNKMRKLFDEGKINKNNIVAFLDAYEADSEIQKRDKSAIETIIDEWGASGTGQQKNVLFTVLNTLCEAAKDAGVSDSDIQKAKTKFEESYNKEYNSWNGALRATNPKDMEEAIDFLRGAIKAKQTANVEEMSDSEAISSFNESFSTEYNDAQSVYDDAKGDGWSWSAQAGDWVCGLFGCNTIGEMEAKLGDNAKAVKELASAKTENEFKAKYKEVFGIDFDPQKIAAAEAAETNYMLASGYSQAAGKYNNLLKNSANSGLKTLESSVKAALKETGTDDSQINEILNQVYSSCSSDDDKKQALVEFLQTSKDNASSQFRSLSKGKTLEQMGKDAELVRQSAFGTNDIGKDVAQFTENMATTEMVTEIAGDIALTVALAAVPGGAAMGAARMAAQAAKWGAKAVKYGAKGVKLAKAMETTAKGLNTTAKTMNTVQKFQSGTKYTSKAANIAAKTVSGSANAAGGTLINSAVFTNRSKEEIIEMCKQNAIFGAIGVGASELAPKIMQMCKCSSQAANEVAESIINTAGSAGVITAEGGDYESNQALIDLTASILMARFSHVSGAKAAKNADAAAPNTAITMRSNTNNPHEVSLSPKKSSTSGTHEGQSSSAHDSTSGTHEGQSSSAHDSTSGTHEGQSSSAHDSTSGTHEGQSSSAHDSTSGTHEGQSSSAHDSTSGTHEGQSSSAHDSTSGTHEGQSSSAHETEFNVDEIDSKVAGSGGINNLTPEERSQLCRFFGIEEAELGNMTKAEKKALQRKYHPDNHPQEVELYTKYFQILQNIL